MSFLARLLIWTRHERTHKFSLPLTRKFQSPGAARPIRSDSFIPRGPVAFRLRGFDGRRNTCSKVQLEFQRFLFGDARGQRDDSEFWKCCGGIEQPPDLDADQHRHGGGHDFAGDRHRRGFQRREWNVLGLHRCRAESILPVPICSEDRRKRFRQCLHRQRCDEFPACCFPEWNGDGGARHHDPAGEPERYLRPNRNLFSRGVGIRHLTYQWKKGGTAIGGATAASYTTPATTSAESGTQFTVVVTDSTGSVTSNPATLTVTASAVAPSITAQPANKTVTAGQTATFSVTATGTAPLTYQWKKNGTASAAPASASYTTPATAASDNNAKFTVTVTNSVSSATSNAATLTVNVPPSITTQPANRTVNAGQTATFSVVATGTGTLTYQWKKNGAAIGGATAASYTTPATVASDNGASFTVTVTGTSGSVTSNAATLTVNGPPTITAQPASKTVVVGQTATFSVTATGTGTLTYQWKKGGTAIGGATSSSYTTPATTAGDNGAQFTVTVTNGVGNTTSNPATLTVNAAATLILNASQTA